MKILTIICNIVFLGLVCLSLINGTSQNIFSIFLFLLVTILNIVLMSGSRLDYRMSTFNSKSKPAEVQKEVPAIYRFAKIAAVILNIVLILLLCRIYISKALGGSLIFYFALFMILIPVLSLIALVISRANNYKDIKQTLIFTGISLGVLLFCFLMVMRIWIGNDIKERISIAKGQYPGIAEDALIAYLSDTTHTSQERSDVAIWTLGQIRSQKALPILKNLYKDDPAGTSCKYHHDRVLCQYEIHKAIVSIEHKWLGAKEKNWFGSWSRLNK